MFDQVLRSARDVSAVLDAGGDMAAELSRQLYRCIDDLHAGEILWVISREPQSHPQIARWCTLTGHALLEYRQDNGDTLYWIRKT